MKQLKVLIVEDQSDTRKALRSAAREVGLIPITHTGGESSYDAFHRADMLIMSWHLPEIDPNALLTNWLNGHRGPVGVLYSEMPDTTQAWLLSHRLVWNVCPQPPSYEALRNTMRNLLDRYRTSVLVFEDVFDLKTQVRRLWRTVSALSIVLLIVTAAGVLFLLLKG